MALALALSSVPTRRAQPAVRPDGPPVVAVHVTPARIVLPDALGTSAWVDVHRPEIRVAAWASGKDLPFYASRSTVFARWWRSTRASRNPGVPMRSSG
jgi:hypothetical protein